ncbi:MAG: transcriptional repressor [Cellvibrio sp.]|jgi:Fur family zinc uptake transcriptional regulator|nr:transcriptional repressor [Cellvibrio sp.]
MNIDKVIQRATASCEKTGSKLTEKRKRVFVCLLKAKKPLSAYEIADTVRAEYEETVPAMSVYRMLDFLEQENLVHKLKSTNKFVACSHIACDHAHEVPQFLICDNCGSVKEIGIKREIMDALTTSVEGAGYQLQSPQLELHCLCEVCAES